MTAIPIQTTTIEVYALFIANLFCSTTGLRLVVVKAGGIPIAWLNYLVGFFFFFEAFLKFVLLLTTGVIGEKTKAISFGQMVDEVKDCIALFGILQLCTLSTGTYKAGPEEAAWT